MEFYCTAGRGTHQFVAMELKHVFSENTMVKSTDGKTYFNVHYTGNDLYHRLVSLKSIERIFVQCLHEQFDKLDRRGLLTLLHTKLNDLISWKNCLSTLHKVDHNFIGSNINPVEDNCEPARKKHKGMEHAASFRVSCRFSGYPRKQLDNKKTSKQMGVLISKLLGWRIDLRRPKFEINIHLSDDTLTVGIPVCDKPLSMRTYIKHCGLRTPIAWIMVKLLDIRPGDIVLDPMCGCGTILLEAAHCYQTSSYIGVDKDTSQLNLAEENVCYAGNNGCGISLIQGDALNLTLLENSVSHIVTDAPFGQNHRVTGDLHQFYVSVLVEMCRVLKAGGRIVLLTSSSMCKFLKKNISVSSSFRYHDYDSHLDKPLECVSENVCTDSQNQSDVYQYDGAIQSPDMSTISVCHSQLSLLELTDVYCVKLGETEGGICVLQKNKEINEKT